MRIRGPLLLLLISGVLATATAQDSTEESGRHILRKTMPAYPEIARKMNIGGTVKLVAIVAPDGKVKSIEPQGGSPILIEAAKAAISQWRYVPASAESRENVELHFSPSPR